MATPLNAHLNRHWEKFPRFVKAELATGGPDPQLRTMARLSEGQPLEQRIWLAGCYCAHHCVPSAHAVWQNWNVREMTEESAQNVENWLGTNWHALPVRPEMRSHRMIWKRAKCLQDFAALSLELSSLSVVGMTYDELWKFSIDSVKFFGRYMAIKFMEQLRQIGLRNVELRDLRGRDAWSPRRALAMLWPNVAGLQNEYDKSDAAVQAVEIWTETTRDALASQDIVVSFFQLQVLLCEYREALVGGYYPGASLDEELEFMEQAETRFDQEPIRAARAALFLPEHLGELNEWDGLRRERFAEFKETR